MSLDLRVAVRASAEDLRALSDAELFALADAVEAETGWKVSKQGERETAVQKALQDELQGEFEDDVIGISEDELGSLPESSTPEDVDAFLARVTRAMDARDVTKTAAILTAGISAVLLLARRTTRKILVDRGRIRPVQVSASLTQADENAIAALSGNNVFWIGNFWSDALARRISETVSREAHGVGLGREAVGRIVKGAVQDEFPLAAVPDGWTGSVDGYFEMLGGVVRNASSNVGAVNTMGDAEVERCVFQAVLDQRTSEICQELHGTVFTLTQVSDQVERYLSARDPADVKTVAPWVTAEQARGFAGSATGDDRAAAFAEAGISVPPLHGRCRSILLPV